MPCCWSWPTVHSRSTAWPTTADFSTRSANPSVERRSRAAFVAVKLDMQAMRVAVAAGLAEVAQPRRALAHFFQCRCLGHQEHLVPGDFAMQRREHVLQLVDVLRFRDDEFELIR